MKHLNKDSVLNADNHKFDAEAEALRIASKLMGKPNPDWTQDELEAIFSNLLDIYENKIYTRFNYPLNKNGHLCKVMGQAVVTALHHGSKYNGIKLVKNSEDETLIYLW